MGMRCISFCFSHFCARRVWLWELLVLRKHKISLQHHKLDLNCTNSERYECGKRNWSERAAQLGIQEMLQFDAPCPNRLFVQKFTQVGLFFATTLSVLVLLVCVPVMIYDVFLVWNPIEGKRSTYFKGITTIFILKLFLNLVAATWGISMFVKDTSCQIQPQEMRSQ